MKHPTKTAQFGAAGHPRRGGFTLTEILVAVLIVGVLAGIAIPVYLGQRERAQDAAAISDLRNTLSAAKAAAVPYEGKYTTVGAAEIRAIEKGLTFHDALAADADTPVTELTEGGDVWVIRSSEVGGAVPFDASRHFFALRKSDSGRVFCLVEDNQQRAGIGRVSEEAAAGPLSEIGQENCQVFERVSAGGPGAPEGGTGGSGNEHENDDPEGGTPQDPVVNPPCHYDPGCFAANAWGDPHIVTYDGLGYEFMTIGDYVFTRSTGGLEGYPAVNIQIRNERTDGLHYDWVTSVSGVAAEVPSADGGSNIITYLLGDGLHINGNPVTLEDETPLSLDDDPSNLHASGYVVRKGSWIRVVWPGTEDLTISRPGLDIRPRTNHLNLHTYLTADYARLVEGVGGYPELVPNPYNDLLLTGGGKLAVPTSNHRIHTDLAEAWAVEGSDSLFVRAGHTPLARDAEFPARFTQNDNPPSIVDDVDPEDFQQAQDFCVEAGVHPNNVPACIVDWLAAGGNPTHEEEAVQSALEATIPTLLIVDDEWDYMLDFEDGQAPPTSTWARDCCGHYTSFAEYAEEGGWVINENDTQRGGRLFYKTKTATVGTNFTLQTALQVTPHTDEGQPFKSTQFGVAIADGSQAWKVIVGPWWIQDGNAVGNPDKIWITNTTTRKPQIRISKQGSVATLYVDGHEAFQLTGASTNSNYVHFGDMGGGADGGKVNYEYIAWAHEAKGDKNMTWWEPERWVYGLDFSTEDTTPQLGGWTYHRSGHYSSFQQYRENGVWVINEEHTQRGGTLHYSMSNAVGPVTTFQADVRIFPRNDQDSPFTSNSVRMQLADKNKLYQVILYPTSVYDPDSKKAYATDLVNRYAQIRIVRTPERATLYVDGHEAFDLQGSTNSNNTIAWGIFSGNPDGAKVAFDNIVISPRDLGTEGMKTWVPNGWLHTLNFDDGRGPEDHGWAAAGSLAGTSFLEDGRYVIEDTNPNWSQYRLYRLSNAVTENFTFQADVRAGATESTVYPYTINNAGLQISDGQKMYKVRIHPTYVSDGNRSETLPDNKYVTDLHSRSAQIRIAKNAAGAALYVDGQHAMDLVGVDTTTNEIAFGLLTNLADRTGRVEFDNIQFAAQDLSWMGMNHWKPNPWAHLLTFDDGQDPIQHGWALAKNGSVNVTIEDGALVIEDTNPNWSQYNAYRFASAAADEMTVQADIKVGPATSGHAFNLTNVGLRIADGTTIWGARVHADRVEDRNDTSKSVSVDFTSGFHTVAISKTAGGAALYVDGQYAFDLTGVAGSTNEVVFGLVDNLADRTGRAWFDNVAIRPDALD